MGYLKIPYLTTSERTGYTPDAHEILYDTDLDTLWYGDGVTAGGIELATVTGSTNLAVANVTATTLDVTSDTGTDATIPAATITDAGLLTAADKVKVNDAFLKSTDDTDDITEGATNKFNVTHTGEVTGATSLTLDKTAISNRTTVTAVGADYILIGDTSDSNNLKKALISDISPAGMQLVTDYNNIFLFMGS
jgi:hypothetical protein